MFNKTGKKENHDGTGREYENITLSHVSWNLIKCRINLFLLAQAKKSGIIAIFHTWSITEWLICLLTSYSSTLDI